MMKLFSNIKTLILLSSAALWWSCSQTADTPTAPEPEPDGPSITFYIPALNFGEDFNPYLTKSRADLSDPLDLQKGEGTLQSLYLVTFKEDINNEGKFEYDDIIDIANKGNVGSAVTNSYNESYYTLKLGQGKYKFYLFANFKEYWKNGETGRTDAQFEEYLQDETQISNLILTYKENISARELPMACMYDEILIQDDAAENGYSPLKDSNDNLGVLEISPSDVRDKTKKYIYAPLKHFCSKVRYTILFDNSPEDSSQGKEAGFSSSFLTNEINFSKVAGLKTLCKDTSMAKPTAPVADASHLAGPFSSSLNRVAYPDETKDTEKDYLNISSASTVQDYLSILSDEIVWEETEAKRAWQGGPVYLPENTEHTAGTNRKTKIHIDGSGLGIADEGYDIEIPQLLRGTFYDVVAKVTKSNVMDVQIYVKVSPWIYNSQPQEW